MKVILDTNVFVSGIFFPLGRPRQILQAWKHGKLNLVISPEIFSEYQGTSEDLQNKYPTAAAADFLSLVLKTSEIYRPEELPEPVCEDPDDDMFIACALASGVKIIISGDKLLLKVSGYKNIEVLTPRQFYEHYLKI